MAESPSLYSSSLNPTPRSPGGALSRSCMTHLFWVGAFTRQCSGLASLIPRGQTCLCNAKGSSPSHWTSAVGDHTKCSQVKTWLRDVGLEEHAGRSIGKGTRENLRTPKAVLGRGRGTVGGFLEKPQEFWRRWRGRGGPEGRHAARQTPQGAAVFIKRFLCCFHQVLLEAGRRYSPKGQETPIFRGSPCMVPIPAHLSSLMAVPVTHSYSPALRVTEGHRGVSSCTFTDGHGH